ncbi:hypothetical protein MNQ95_07305 [Pseudoxanthomonas daejeonensis]|uniref:hypothetical protein n=1 Tax=Pseudoxanthomonas daejeonensis TaxID=266062 RepID=UPI001F542C05|nr:hypothetical protein [Pseudoxanthomonas daejeonensis]UNK58873.1 hypothetical protein MNQ95_07305 [Pseudoxanthomonas daejeonensis]
MLSSRRCIRLAPIAAAWLTVALLVSIAGCRREPVPEELPGAASEPAGAVRQLATHLQRNDLEAFARDALPAAERAHLAEAWSQGHSRWPLTELPLDEQLGPLLAVLSAPESEKELRRSFERQMAGQDAALRDATRSLALFGTQYVRTQGGYSEEEQAHYAQVIAALGAWTATAPLGDRARANAAIDQLAAAARATGLDGDAALDAAGMEESLRRLGPFAAATKAVLADYGLDLDRSLSDLRTGLVEESGDQATVRIHYPLAGTEIDTTVSLTRRDGHWYLTDYLLHAAALLAEPSTAPAPALPGLPAPPPPSDPAAAR